MSTREDLIKEAEHEMTYFKPHTKSQYRAQQTDYMDFVKRRDPTYESWNTRVMVYKYIDYLRKKGFSQSYINGIIRGAVNLLFKVSGLRLPVKLPPIERAIYTDTGSMTWQDEQVVTMIKTARQMDIRTQALLAVITTWTPRAGEVIKIEKKGINFKTMVITIPTLKHNIIRHHTIPDQIQYVVCKYDWEQMTETQLRDWFDELCSKSSIQRLPRQSIHAFRHNLKDHYDLLGFTEKEEYDFMGWVPSGTGASYSHPLKFNPHNDQKFYEKHPFLKLWI